MFSDVDKDIKESRITHNILLRERGFKIGPKRQHPSRLKTRRREKGRGMKENKGRGGGNKIDTKRKLSWDMVQ
jgi:hypothetical protein